MDIDQKKLDAFASASRGPARSASGRPSDVQASPNEVNCPVCGYGIIAGTNGKRKLRTRVLVFSENGSTMGICPKCKTQLRVPVALAK